MRQCFPHCCLRVELVTSARCLCADHPGSQSVDGNCQEYEALREEREFEEEFERMKHEQQERNARLQQQAVQEMEEKLRSHVRCRRASLFTNRFILSESSSLKYLNNSPALILDLSEI